MAFFLIFLEIFCLIPNHTFILLECYEINKIHSHWYINLFLFIYKSIFPILLNKTLLQLSTNTYKILVITYKHVLFEKLLRLRLHQSQAAFSEVRFWLVWLFFLVNESQGTPESFLAIYKTVKIVSPKSQLAIDIVYNCSLIDSYNNHTDGLAMGVGSDGCAADAPRYVWQIRCRAGHHSGSNHWGIATRWIR